MAAVLLAWPILAGADIMDKADSCFAATYERAASPIRELTVRVHKIGLGGEEEQTIASVAFTEWDVPNQIFETDAFCRLEDGKAHCSVDCDGGNATLMLADDGRMLVETSGLRTGVSGDASLLLVNDADGGSLTGIFALKERSDGAICRPAMDRRFAELAAGDISQRVRDAETMLNTLGQFLEYPDTVFDQTTSAAVTTFQRQFGLVPTGIIDEKTAQLLTSAARGGGGC